MLSIVWIAKSTDLIPFALKQQNRIQEKKNTNGISYKKTKQKRIIEKLFECHISSQNL